MTQSSCLCGANVITYSNTPMLSFRCHCLDERKLTGAAFALNILWSTTDLRVLKGEFKTWGQVVESGNTITNHCCGQCGSLLYRTSDGYPDVTFIKAGCIDGKDVPSEYALLVLCKRCFSCCTLIWIDQQTCSVRCAECILKKTSLTIPSSRFVPEVELFTRSRVPWVPAIEGAKQEIGDFAK